MDLAAIFPQRKPRRQKSKSPSENVPRGTFFRDLKKGKAGSRKITPFFKKFHVEQKLRAPSEDQLECVRWKIIPDVPPLTVLFVAAADT